MKKVLLSLLAGCMAAWGLTPQEVVVVYNAGSVRSADSARLYAAVRGIPQAQLVALEGIRPDAQALSRRDYERLIAEPLLSAARLRDWQWPAAKSGGTRRMAAMVLMPDLPLRVNEQVQRPLPKNPDGTPDYRVRPPEDAAAVDSELALLGANYTLTGPLNNPFYKKDAPLSKAQPPVLAVCRIDAPQEAAIRRMIQEPAAVEKKGLWGWTVIDQGGPYPQGDAVFKANAALAQKMGQPLFYETSPETLADTFPLPSQTAVYFGWYTMAANGPFKPAAPADFRLAPGAVACHLHSFSCTDIKNPNQWAPALLCRGAAVTTGNVAEPLLAGCLNFEVFFDRLMKGYTVAEAGLMAMPMLSWQAIVIGDPLYRPYAAWKNKKQDTANPYVAWARMLHHANGNDAAVEAAVQKQLAGRGAAFYAELYAWHCANAHNLHKAADYFRMAAAAATTAPDKLRNRLMHITALYAAGDKKTAASLMHNCLDDTPNSPYRPAVEKTAATVLREEGWKPEPKK